MKLARTISAFLAMASAGFCAQSDSGFKCPHTHLGAANFEGKLCTWFEVGSIQVAEGVKLPLRLRFSAVPTSGVALFGKFWWCPLFESTFVPVSEHIYSLSAPGGGQVFFLKKKDGTLASGDGKWKGTLGTDEAVELKAPGGWSFTYRRGRLSEAGFKDMRLRWNYENNRFKSLSDSRQGALVSVDYGTGGQPARISTPGGLLKCEVQKVPVITDTGNASGVISGFEYSLAGIFPGSGFWKFPITLSPEGDYSMAFSNSARYANTYVWDASSGILKSEGGWAYEVTKKEDGRPFVSRKNRGGEVESYFYDEKTGISEQALPDGSLITRSYFIGVGPAQYKIRKLVLSREGKDIEERHWSYDEKGRLIREIRGDIQRLWEYSPDDTLLSREETRAGALVSRQTYDSQGRIVSLVRPRLELRYAYDSGRTVIQRLESGKVLAVQVAESSGGPGHVFFTKPDSGELESRVKAPTKAALQELENSKIVALRAITLLKNEASR